tara:strand:- start:182 stop:466 length:285 start_codon:yes stop_codon:yes gene_type:complete
MFNFVRIYGVMAKSGKSHAEASLRMNKRASKPTSERASRRDNMKFTDFTDDEEKMRDFFALDKKRFLEMYSYLTEEEYNLTKNKLNQQASEQKG